MMHVPSLRPAFARLMVTGALVLMLGSSAVWAQTTMPTDIKEDAEKTKTITGQQAAEATTSSTNAAAACATALANNQPCSDKPMEDAVRADLAKQAQKTTQEQLTALANQYKETQNSTGNSTAAMAGCAATIAQGGKCSDAAVEAAVRADLAKKAQEESTKQLTDLAAQYTDKYATTGNTTAAMAGCAAALAQKQACSDKQIEAAVRADLAKKAQEEATNQLTELAKQYTDKYGTTGNTTGAMAGCAATIAQGGKCSDAAIEAAVRADLAKKAQEEATKQLTELAKQYTDKYATTGNTTGAMAGCAATLAQGGKCSDAAIEAAVRADLAKKAQEEATNQLTELAKQYTDKYGTTANTTNAMANCAATLAQGGKCSDAQIEAAVRADLAKKAQEESTKQLRELAEKYTDKYGDTGNSTAAAANCAATLVQGGQCDSKALEAAVRADFAKKGAELTKDGFDRVFGDTKFGQGGLGGDVLGLGTGVIVGLIKDGKVDTEALKRQALAMAKRRAMMEANKKLNNLTSKLPFKVNLQGLLNPTTYVAASLPNSRTFSTPLGQSNNFAPKNAFSQVSCDVIGGTCSGLGKMRFELNTKGMASTFAASMAGSGSSLFKNWVGEQTGSGMVGNFAKDIANQQIDNLQNQGTAFANDKIDNMGKPNPPPGATVDPKG